MDPQEKSLLGVFLRQINTVSVFYITYCILRTQYTLQVYNIGIVFFIFNNNYL